jgi:hypothetical protein
MSTLFLFKIIAAPLLICVATLVSRRWGSTIGGWFAGLPLTSGPVSVFFALERGPLFARDAAAATILGVVAVVAFAVTYGRVALTHGPVASFTAALSAYLLVVGAASQVQVPVWPAAALVVASVVAGLLMIGSSPPISTALPTPAWDLPFRMIAAASMVFLLTELGRAAGPRAAGVLSPFPVFACTMAVFSHIVGGPSAAHRLTKGVVIGSLAFAAFFVVVAIVVTHLTLPAAYALASCAALAINGMALQTLLRAQRRV